MSSPPPFSRSARAVFYVGPPLSILTALALSTPTAVALPVILSPTYYAMKLHRNQPPASRANTDICLWSYLFTGTAGITLAGVGQLVLVCGFFSFFFGKDTISVLTEAAKGEGVPAATRAVRAENVWAWRDVLMRVWGTYVVAGIWEEGIKMLPLLYVRSKRNKEDDKESDKARKEGSVWQDLHYAIAAGLGFATMENALATYGTASAEGKGWQDLVISLAERTVVGTLGHVLTGCLVGLRTIRADHDGQAHEQPKTDSKPHGAGSSSEEISSKSSITPSNRWAKMRVTWWVLAPAIWYHGTFNFVLMSMSAMEGHLIWVHPSSTQRLVTAYALAGGVQTVCAWHVWKEWKRVKAMVIN